MDHRCCTSTALTLLSGQSNNRQEPLVMKQTAQKYEAAEKIGFASGRMTVAECRTIIARFANDHQKFVYLC